MPKSNIFCFMQYEDSNPLGRVMDFLTAHHFAAVLSPVHDSDEWTDEDVRKWRESRPVLNDVVVSEGAEFWERPTGEMRRDAYGCMVPVTERLPVPKVGDLKKEHRHVYVQFDYSMPLKTALATLAPLQINYMEPVKSRRAYLRYMCHLDTPEKARYAVEDVISLGGVDISCLWSQDDGEKFVQDGRIMEVIRKHRFHSVNALCSYFAKRNERQMYAECKAHYGYWQQFMRGGLYVVEREDVEDEGGDADEVAEAQRIA